MYDICIRFSWSISNNSSSSKIVHQAILASLVKLVTIKQTGSRGWECRAHCHRKYLL